MHHKETTKVLLEVMKPNQPLFRGIFKNACPARMKKQGYLVPTLEMALALKFGPMVSLNRADEKKYQDAHDFIRMVKVNPEINLEKLATLGELVYPGGGKEIVDMVRRVRAGKKLNL